MSDTRGHPYKFRVTDGMNRTATEISCPDDKARRDWMDAIRLVGGALCIQAPPIDTPIHRPSITTIPLNVLILGKILKSTCTCTLASKY